MGNGPSQHDIEKLGYRVLGVQPNSPAARGGLVSFFDFIVAANGVPLRTLDSRFVDLIKASEDKPLPLTVYNCKNHSMREITLIPSRNWPGEGMLGVTIRFDSFHEAEEHLCRVLDVEVNSPAELAGLIPENDYLLGTAEKVFRDADILFEELSANLERPVEFYVYNSESDEVRVAIIMPSDQWGGVGILGANIAHGFLHGLPSSCCNSIGISNIGGLRSMANSAFGHNDPSAIHADAYGASSSSATYAPAIPTPSLPPVYQSSPNGSAPDLHQPELVHVSHPNPHNMYHNQQQQQQQYQQQQYPSRMTTGGVVADHQDDISTGEYATGSAHQIAPGGQRFNPNLSIDVSLQQQQPLAAARPQH